MKNLAQCKQCLFSLEQECPFDEPTINNNECLDFIDLGLLPPEGDIEEPEDY